MICSHFSSYLFSKLLHFQFLAVQSSPFHDGDYLNPDCSLDHCSCQSLSSHKKEVMTTINEKLKLRNMKELSFQEKSEVSKLYQELFFGPRPGNSVISPHVARQYNLPSGISVLEMPPVSHHVLRPQPNEALANSRNLSWQRRS